MLLDSMWKRLKSGLSRKRKMVWGYRKELIMGERIVYDKKETGMPVSFCILSES